MTFGHGHMNGVAAFPRGQPIVCWLLQSSDMRHGWKAELVIQTQKVRRICGPKCGRLMSLPRSRSFYGNYKLAQQSLPTSDLFHHQKMATQPACGLFGSQDYRRHSLIECNMVRYVWALEDEELVEVMMQNREPDAKRFIFSLLEALPHVDFVKLLVTLWAIWYAHRKALHEQSFQALYATNQFAGRYISELEACKLKKPLVTPQVIPRQRCRWIAPADGVDKIHVDGAISHNSAEGCVQRCVQGFHRQVLGFFSDQMFRYYRSFIYRGDDMSRSSCTRL